MSDETQYEKPNRERTQYAETITADETLPEDASLTGGNENGSNASPDGAQTVEGGGA